MPLTIQPLRIYLAYMELDKTIHKTLLAILIMLSLTIFNMVVEGMATQVAVIEMVAETMVVYHPTLEEPIPFPEIHILSVLDVAKITMSWPVQPLLLKENKICSNRIIPGHPIGSLILFNLILLDTWHLQHKFRMPEIKPASFCHRYILLPPAPAPQWCDMMKEYF
jgi:hypothetical protein